jgi:hypothetical protein
MSTGVTYPCVYIIYFIAFLCFEIVIKVRLSTSTFVFLPSLNRLIAVLSCLHS